MRLTWIAILILAFHHRVTAFTSPRGSCAGCRDVASGGIGRSQSRIVPPIATVNSGHNNDGDCDHPRNQTTASRLAIDLKFIASKFLLEVMGAAGACWGCADVLALRDTAEGAAIARQVALWMGGVFFVRYLRNLQRWYRRSDHSPVDVDPEMTSPLEFASRFVLQVMGGAGAIWGSSEIVTLRNYDNAAGWRVTATVAGCAFLVRWMLQVVNRFATFWSFPLFKQTATVRWFEAGVTTLVLEVLGAAGAMWGFSEIVLLRNPETNVIWRPIALSVGVIFLMQWIVQILDLENKIKRLFNTRRLD